MIEIQQTNPGNWEVIQFNSHTRVTTVLGSGFRSFEEAEQFAASLK